VFVMSRRAQGTAEALLGCKGDRWVHVQAVARRAAQLAHGLAVSDRDTLVAAAWLHDIGYATDVSTTGFHALDGARFLSDEGWVARICALVAHHSCAHFEASERGLAQALVEWSYEEGPVMDALIAADMTVGPSVSIQAAR
jgi:HD superfamily phosphodiesterase